LTAYIATFYSHFDAVSFARDLARKGISAKPMPVPRKLSSSCGTCVGFSTVEEGILSLIEVEYIDQLFKVVDGEFALVLSNHKED